MFYVEIDQTGDNAEAETAEDAIVAAITLMDDDAAHTRIYARRRSLTASFFVGERFIRQANYMALCAASGRSN